MVESTVPEDLYVPQIGDILARNRRKDAVKWTVHSAYLLSANKFTWHKGSWIIPLHLISAKSRWLYVSLSPDCRPDKNWVWIKQHGVLPIKRQGDGMW